MDRFAHGGNIYEPSPVGSWLDFSANINPCGLSPAVRRAVEMNIDDIVHYPDPNALALKRAISMHYEVTENTILLGNGAAELFYLFFYTYRPRTILLPIPSFSEYERAALAARCVVRYHRLMPEQNFSLNLKALIADLKTAECLILGNPNNPTGTSFDRSELLPLVQFCAAHEKWLIVDESFLDFCHSREQKTLRHLVSDDPKLFVIQSMTKFYALPGLRLGFGIANPSVCRHLSCGKDVWNVNLLAQKAGIAALSTRDYQEESRILLQNERDYLLERIKDLKGVQAYHSNANFILLSIQGTKLTSHTFSVKLREYGILVRDCSNYPGLADGFIRIAVRNRKENERLLQAMEAILI